MMKVLIVSMYLVTLTTISTHPSPGASVPTLRDTMLSKLNIVNSTGSLPTDESCIPSGTKYPWWHVGGVWYTAIRAEVSWYVAEKTCREIQPGKNFYWWYFSSRDFPEEGELSLTFLTTLRRDHNWKKSSQMPLLHTLADIVNSQKWKIMTAFMDSIWERTNE